MVGSVSNIAGGNLKTGLFAAAIFPVMLVGSLIVLNRRKTDKRRDNINLISRQN